MSQSDRLRRHRAEQFMSLKPADAFAQYDAMAHADRCDLLAAMEPQAREVLLAALAEREDRHATALGLERMDLAFAGCDEGQ